MVNAGFFMDYPTLRDNNFNSWNTVETFDAYDDSGNPRLLGADGQGPRLHTEPVVVGNLGTTYLLTARGGIYLHEANGITISSIHVTDPTDADTVYTSTATATGAIGGVTTDSELGFVYGYAVTGGAAAIGNNVRLVVKTSTSGMNIADAMAYVYSPDETGANGAGLSDAGSANVIVPTDANPVTTAGTYSGIATGGTPAAAQGGTGEVALQGGTNLIVELPALTPTNGDVIVIQNIGVNGHMHSIHIPIPAARTQTAGAVAATEAVITSLNPKVYKHVFLDRTGTADRSSVAGIQTGTNFLSTTADAVIDFNFREPLASTVTGTWAPGVDDEGTAADVNTVDFSITAAVTTAANSAEGAADAEGVSLTLSGGVAEGVTDHYVGHDAELTVNVSDHSNNPSSFKIKFQKGHAEQAANPDNDVNFDNDEAAILNIISGSAID
jgi:hypothetical protein